MLHTFSSEDISITCFASPQVADLDGDGVPSLLLLCSGGYVEAWTGGPDANDMDGDGWTFDVDCDDLDDAYAVDDCAVTADPGDTASDTGVGTDTGIDTGVGMDPDIDTAVDIDTDSDTDSDSDADSDSDTDADVSGCTGGCSTGGSPGLIGLLGVLLLRRRARGQPANVTSTTSVSGSSTYTFPASRQ